MHVVVVESPAKAKTIGRYLGDGYRVFASYGHVSDLPAKDGSVRPEDGFAMTYVTARRANRVLSRIRAALKDAESLILATDPDREGEAIAWQVLTWLREKDAIGEKPVRRVDFHEITEHGVRDAMAQPREVDMDLVRAQQARRALDYLVGFHLSAVLWRKVPGSRSAGRVQSVALRLVCEREAEIESFVPQEYWTVDVQLEAAGGGSFTARPVLLDGSELDRLGIGTGTMAEDAARRIREGRFTVASVERREIRRNPVPPFTTSTLQQDASRRLGFGVRRTMQLAQTLYEGVEMGGGTVGLITYMRTGSTALSEVAAGQARGIVSERFGPDYLSGAPRLFRSRQRDMREAHEAIRPTDFARLPEAVADRIGPDEGRLYALIWQRAMASQMAAARLERTEADIATDGGDVVLTAAGSVTAFEGFLRVYREARDEDAPDEDAETRLPEMRAGETVSVGDVRSERRFTRPPPRYSEAGLVRALEERGIGRPSTYAAIVGVLRERDYVLMHERRFVPTERGRVVTAFLHAFFGPYVAYGFTADLERDLDRIARGAVPWKGVMEAFWGDFDGALRKVGAVERRAVIAAMDRALESFAFVRGELESGKACASCGNGRLTVKIGRRGAFVGCSNYPACRFRRPLAPGGGEDATVTGGEPRELGEDPATGLAVSLRRGRFGLYIQSGTGAFGGGAKTVSVPRGWTASEITLDVARRLLALPREVGVNPASGETILAGIGRYGPWLKHGETFVSIPDDEDVLTIGLNRAVMLIAEKEERGTS